MALFVYTTLSVFDENGNADTYTFGSVHGAHEWITNNPTRVKHGYAIEELAAYPCDENNTDGQLYYGIRHHEFVDTA